MVTNRYLFGPEFDEGIKWLGDFTDAKHDVLAVSFHFLCTPPSRGYPESLFIGVNFYNDPDKFTRVNWRSEVEHLIDNELLSSPQYDGANCSLYEISVFFDHDDCEELNWRVKPDEHNHIGYVSGRDKDTRELTFRSLTPDEFAKIRSFDDVVSMLSEE